MSAEYDAACEIRSAIESLENCLDGALPQLRDYFAAHAPEQAWSFEVRMSTPRPEPHLETNPSGDRVCVNEHECNAWDRERSKQAAIQWPWIWADAMIAERTKGK